MNRKIKLPLQYDSEGQFIFDSENKMVMEVRGWGWIQKNENPEQFQDDLGNKIVEILNEGLKNSEFVEEVNDRN